MPTTMVRELRVPLALMAHTPVTHQTDGTPPLSHIGPMAHRLAENRSAHVRKECHRVDDLPPRSSSPTMRTVSGRRVCQCDRLDPAKQPRVADFQGTSENVQMLFGGCDFDGHGTISKDSPRVSRIQFDSQLAVRLPLLLRNVRTWEAGEGNGQA